MTRTLTRRRIGAALFLGYLAAALAWPLAGAGADDGVEIEQPWARASAGLARSAGAFLTIRNGGTEADRLVAVASPVAKRAGLHQTVMESDVMKMRHVAAIEVPPGETVMLAPGGYHVMFMGLAAPLVEGQTFALTLTFEKAGEIEVEVAVMKAGAMGHGKMKHGE
jgi:copper(I)-binding protein